MCEEKKLTFREKISARKKEYIEELRLGGFCKRSFVSLLFVLAAAIVIYIVSRNVTAFAEFWSRYPGGYIRAAVTLVTSIVPISLAEVIILFAFPSMIVFLVTTMSSKLPDSVYYKRCRVLVSLTLVLASLYLTTFAPCYFRNPLEKNLGLESKEVNIQTLQETADKLAKELETLKEEVLYASSGAALMPYSYSELVEKVNKAYMKFSADCDFLLTYPSVSKPLMVSSVMTYTHISGLYSFFTGEANINTNYPDFVMPYTIAHEMSHQRGIAAEDEANFVAFLVCIGSDDAFIRSSADVSMYDYILDALYVADSSAYQTAVQKAPSEVRGELSAFAEFFRKYQGSTVSSVTNAVNNTFLQAQGQKDGVLSYGKVVELAVAYYADK